MYFKMGMMCNFILQTAMFVSLSCFGLIFRFFNNHDSYRRTDQCVMSGLINLYDDLKFTIHTISGFLFGVSLVLV